MEDIQHPNGYDNQAAHEELKKMMLRAEILELFFNVDKYGFCSIRVRNLMKPSQTIEYQIGRSGYIWLLEYLANGNADDSKVNPMQPIYGDGLTGDEFRKQMFVDLIDESRNPDIQKERDSIFTKYGKPAYYMNFNYGIIRFFFMKNDDGVKEFLEAKELI